MLTEGGMRRYLIERDVDGRPTRMQWAGDIAREVDDVAEDLRAWAEWHKGAVWFRKGKASSSRAEMAQPDTQECE
jgi:hypothetical protein